uniref:VWFC domain-containing protein n=1 Tax=Panagrellus redivivus TaxID=6233 RepID=A0A7E4ULW5_PANRE
MILRLLIFVSFWGAIVALEDVDEGLVSNIVIPNKVKWSSLAQSVDHPPFAVISNSSNLVPLTARTTRRKRCTCGCSGCDIFPNRPCCGPSCCSSEPLPLACCPPPPPPKPCCQPNFGPCCPATPNCCKKPCCKGQRPEIYEDEEEDFGSAPAPPVADRTCCPPATPAAPPPPPVPPAPPPEPPVECCTPPPAPKSPCGCANCGCGRPCCYYRDAECCRTKPCCPPELPCCPPLPTLPVCCNVAPPCLRACPTCPCRKRISLGKRIKRQNGLDAFHCQQCLAPEATAASASAGPVQHGAKTLTVAETSPKPKPTIEYAEPKDIVEEAPVARAGIGKLFERNRHIRTKRANCQFCVDGRPLKREKRNACIQCNYLQPVYDGNVNVPAYGRDLSRLQTPVPVPIKREKRNGCIPPPTCLALRRRSKRNFNSQYCEPCPGGYAGRKKREDERQSCMDRRKKRAAEGHEMCEHEEDEDTFTITRMKRQAAYTPNGALDIMKVLSKMTANRAAGPGGCLEFPACVLAQKKRRKRMAEKAEQHQKAMRRYKRALEEHEKVVERHKRQFFAPNTAGANCVPCPAWVTLALTSRKRRSPDKDESENIDFQVEDPSIEDLKKALTDIRRREQQFEYEEDHCEQTADCMNDAEYGEFMRKYHLGRKKRQVFFPENRPRKQCISCHGKTSRGRSKRAFGKPTINASAGNCYAFPACRTRVKRNNLNLNLECAMCTPDAEPLKKVRVKRLGQVQCYPCPKTPQG